MSIPPPDCRLLELHRPGVNGFDVLEFIHAQFTRPVGSSSLEYTDNIFHLNFKIGLGKGVLQRRYGGGGDADD